jgi:hypothetical protein
MDKFHLTDVEEAAFKAIKEVLLGLPARSQYNVLRNTAHAMDREVVRPGATRAAAAVAGSTARTLADGVGKASAAKPGKKEKREKYSPEFLERHKGLVDEKKRLDEIASRMSPVTLEIKASLREASKALREAWASWALSPPSGAQESKSVA